MSPSPSMLYVWASSAGCKEGVRRNAPPTAKVARNQHMGCADQHPVGTHKGSGRHTPPPPHAMPERSQPVNHGAAAAVLWQKQSERSLRLHAGLQATCRRLTHSTRGRRSAPWPRRHLLCCMYVDARADTRGDGERCEGWRCRAVALEPHQTVGSNQWQGAAGTQTSRMPAMPCSHTSPPPPSTSSMHASDRVIARTSREELEGRTHAGDKAKQCPAHGYASARPSRTSARA